MSGLEALEPGVASASAGRATLFKELSAIAVVVLPFLLVSEDAVSIRYLLEDFLCLLLAVGILVWMVLERQLFVCFLDLGQFSVSGHA